MINHIGGSISGHAGETGQQLQSCGAMQATMQQSPGDGGATYKDPLKRYFKNYSHLLFFSFLCFLISSHLSPPPPLPARTKVPELFQVDGI